MQQNPLQKQLLPVQSAVFNLKETPARLQSKRVEQCEAVERDWQWVNVTSFKARA